jgi:AhpD family alkylhydroperoxidase
MLSRPRIPSTEITGLKGYIMKWFSRRMFGEVPESLGVAWNNQAVLSSMMVFGRKAEKWKHLDPNLKSYAHMAVASLIGCSFCLDLHYFQVHNRGLDEAKASEVPRWRESTVFTPLERDVMEYAEAMSKTPPRVTDELSHKLLEQLGAPAMVELAAWVGAANMVTRGNIAMGITSQGFSKVCERPLAKPSGRYSASA